MNAATTTDTKIIHLTRTLRGPAAKAWKLWTTKEGLEKWWGPEGFTSEVLALDVRVGGRFEIAMTARRKEIIDYLTGAGVPLTSKDGGSYGEVRTNARLAWSQGVDFIPGVAKYDSNTTVEFDEQADGTTRVRVTLDAMHDAHWTKMKVMGWEGQLDKLEALLHGGAQ